MFGFKLRGRIKAFISKTIRESKLYSERNKFDASYYVSAYPDVGASGIDPFEHFMQHGWREGRNPSRHFNTLLYRDSILKGKNVNPLSHFTQSYLAENKTFPSLSNEGFLEIQRVLVADLLDPNYYRAQIKSSISTDLVAHYLTQGWKEGLAPSPAFDVNQYMAENGFVRALGIAPLYHFASQNRMQSRSLSAPTATESQDAMKPAFSEIESVVRRSFDSGFYLKTNPDVRDSGQDPVAHFLKYGWREGRKPSVMFDTRYYLGQNQDLLEGDLNPFYHYLKAGREKGLRPNPVGTRLYPSMKPPSITSWERVSPRKDVKASRYIVVMPVYRGYEETLASIFAVLTHDQEAEFALHVINDVTPDPELDAALAGLAQDGKFSYFKNAQNLGFVKTVNTALREFPDKEIVLLNSDALVHGNWLDRIVRHAERDRSIATITPMSNNATICSYPVTNDNNLIELEITASVLDDVAALCNKGRFSEIPTGVGFCLYMSSQSRSEIGIFDEESFGRGYGEENDFCFRAANAGFKNVLAEDVFVYHAGQVSFSEFASGEYGAGQVALIKKHPDYPQRIKQHIESDPSLIGRMRLDLYRVALEAKSNCVVYVYHALSGGVVTHVRQMTERLHAEGVSVINIRVGVSSRWGVEIKPAPGATLYCPNLVPINFHSIAPILKEFLGWLKPRLIHVHSFAGFDWHSTTAFLDIIRASGIPYYFTLHDYSVLCHRNDLVLTDGRYCGLPDLESCRKCVASDRSFPEGVDPATRHDVYGTFLRGAAAVFAPSVDTKVRVESTGIVKNVLLRPHEIMTNGGPRIETSNEDGIIRIATLGAIGVHKGSRLILNLARDARARNLPLRYHIIGYSDITEELVRAGVQETGRYTNDLQAFACVRAVMPTCILLPSIWPETYCYALSLAFQLKIPPVVFDLGAQHERVAAAGFGFSLPYRMTRDVMALNDLLCTIDYKSALREEVLFWGGHYNTIMSDYYSYV